MSAPTRTLAACLAAVVSVALVAIGAANLKSWTSGTSEDQTRLPVSASSTELDAEARAIFQAFNGTRLQNDASGVLQAWALNGAMDVCMAARGYPEWDWSQGRNYAPDLDPLTNSIFFAQPLDNTVSETAVSIRPRMVAEEELMSDDPDATTLEAIRDCVESTPEQSDDAVAKTSQPLNVTQLREDWWRMMYDLDDRFGDVEAYNECMADSDLSILNEQGRSVEELDEALNSLVPGADQIPASATADAASDAWQRLLSAEREVSAADWRCRADVYNAHVDDVRAAVANFAARHAAEIDLARQGWQAIEVRAGELGFSAQTGEFDPR